ncbi:ClpXP protease specificity-enhancing factor [Sulfurisoma sediminicola]|uniref:Stringent starvation protein B n=1 Tax=Sulfurisoma sediminicola TaxID=1381557 RepID=A0A497XE83_9PROT|nr:ClpXP protease specificity-enhancing factor [Sulfurisoma sediminicola]RLJ65300.1 stringent starvation protein B [Sulfurisoma sediminicola]
MVTTKPYLIRAIYEWCADQGYTPYLAVAVDARTRVPREYVKDGQIVLNVAADATGQLQMGNEEITFQARFNGVAFPVSVPVAAVAAIYARENGQGMAFEAGEGLLIEASEEGDGDVPVAAEDGAAAEPPAAPPAGRPHLTRIK